MRPLAHTANDAATGKPIKDTSRVAEIWLTGEPTVRHYATPELALKALAGFEKAGKTARVVYAQNHDNGIKLLADKAWFVVSPKGQIDAFLLQQDAEAFAQKATARSRISPKRNWPCNTRPQPRVERHLVDTRTRISRLPAVSQHSPDLRDARDRRPIPSGRAFPIRHRLCGRSGST